jgi:hypothetical protein
VLPQNGNSLLQTVALRAIPCVDIQANQHQNYYRPAVPEDQNFGDGDLDSISDLSVSTYLKKTSKKNISKNV